MVIIDQLSAPTLLTFAHVVTYFNCKTLSLDEWLKNRALANQIHGGSRTYVLCNRNHVIGYYALAVGSVLQEDTHGRFRRNMPNLIPIVVLGRLAIDYAWQKRGLGRALVQDVILRINRAADIIGVRGILVHALSDQAKSFYESVGFVSSPLHPLTLMVSIKDARRYLG